MQVRVYETLADIEGIRSHWDRLLGEFRGATTFSTWEWLAPWWRAFGQRRVLLVLAFFNGASQLVGLAPLSVEKRKMYLADLKIVRFWGDGSGDSDNLDFPVRAGFEDQVAGALLNYLTKESGRWDHCELNTMPEDSAVGNCLSRQLHDRSWVAYRHQQTGSAIPMPETWNAYLVQLSAKERGKIAYRRRLLEKKYQIRLYKCENQAELEVCLSSLFRLHQRRWNNAGEPGSFMSAERCRFYSEMAALLLARGYLEFWLLDLNGETVAAQFGFCFDRTFFSLQEGYDPLYSSDSVGYVLRAHVIRQLIAAGVRRYDFLAGESASKTRWDAAVTQYLNVHFARPASKGSLYLQTVNAASEGKEWLRQNLSDSAWEALHRLNCTIRGIKMQSRSKE